MWNTDRHIPSTIDEYSEFFAECGDAWDARVDFFDPNQGVTPGPLMTAAVAMFGNNSFFNVASTASETNYSIALSQICQAENIPFSRYITGDGYYLNNWYDWRTICYNLTSNTDASDNATVNTPSSEDLLYGMVYTWAVLFNQTCHYWDKACQDDSSVDGNDAMQAFEVGMALANEAWLEQTATQTRSEKARAIYTGPGSPDLKPLMSMASMIAISVLLILQILSLLLLCVWIYSAPTWTDRLDSYAIAQLTRGLDDVVPDIGHANAESLKKLKNVDGVVGFASRSEEDQDNLDKVESSGFQLARSAPGAIGRSLFQSTREGHLGVYDIGAKQSLLHVIKPNTL